MSEPLAPGIYLGLDDEDYFGDPAVSYSGIKQLLRSPAEFWLGSIWNPNRDEKKVEKDRMAQGKLFHCILLEPQKFEDRYFIMPGGRWSDHKKMVNRNDYQNTAKAANVIKRLEKAERLFDPRFGYPEVTVVWRDPATGVLCRAKHDFFCWEWTVDYKTVDSIEEEFIKMTFRRYKYHLQHAHYSSGRKIVREMIRRGEADFYGDFSEEFRAEFMAAEDDFFIFVFQGKDEPFTAIPMMLDDSSADAGNTEKRKALMLFQRYLDAYGTEKPWPAAGRGIRTFSMYYGFDPTEAL